MLVRRECHDNGLGEVAPSNWTTKSDTSVAMRIVLIVNESLRMVDRWRLNGLILGKATHSLLPQIVTRLAVSLLCLDCLFKSLVLH